MALKYSKASSFSLRNATKANLEKSSTIASTYLLPPMLCVLIGPMRSMCNSFSGLIVWSLSNFLWNLFTCFFFRKSSQIEFSGSLSLGTLLTRLPMATRPSPYNLS